MQISLFGRNNDGRLPDILCGHNFHERHTKLDDWNGADIVITQ
jgi:hypothetical protein